jgi:SulP family sulfate permease
MLVVTLVTIILHNLALAVIVGVIVSAFLLGITQNVFGRKTIDEQGIKHYEIYGPLFFGSVAAFNDKFDILDDPEEIIIDFREWVVDMSKR